MKEFLSALFTYIFIVAMIILGLAGISFLSYQGYKYFAPRYEQVRYDTFKNSQTYNDGMLRDLVELQQEYVKANDEQKAGLKALIIHRFEVYDINRLPPDLQGFYLSLKQN
jgi:hypothetical protein